VPAAPSGRVNDYAGLLRPAEREHLETRLAERERATGAQVVVAIFASLQGENLEDYSIRLAQQWRIGQKSLDNGVILIIFVNDRKIRLEVGYGLEPVIPDIVAGTLIRETLAPRFREQRYAEGIEAATDAIYARIAGETGGPHPPARTAPARLPRSAALLLFLIFGVFAVAVLSAMRNASRRAYTAGGRGWSSHPPIVFGGGPGGWSSGGGGWSSGGGRFSGGGGSFGGGGASGDW
jgi:uncharacterized protein